jgi:hypothetical protein
LEHLGWIFILAHTPFALRKMMAQRSLLTSEAEA